MFKIIKFVIFAVISTALFIGYSCFASAEDEIFSICHTAEGYDDVSFRFPEGFHIVNSVDGSFIINGENSVGQDELSVSCMHSVVLEADNKECVLLYPQMYWNILELDTQIQGEIRAAKGNPDCYIENFITTIALDDMSEYCNADTIHIYRYELPKPFMDKYKYCIGVHLEKYAHPMMAFKVITDDKGLAKADDYLQRLLSNVQFGDKVTERGIQAERDFMEYRNYLKSISPKIH